MTQDENTESSEFIPLDTDESTDTQTNSEEELSERQQNAKETIEANVPDFVLTSHLPEDPTKLTVFDHGECDRCERHSERLKLEIDESIRYICEKCRKEILKEIDETYWHDRFHQSHYDIISAYLSSLDEIWCVKDHAYQGGEMWVHTGHCDTAVVQDILNHFGSIYSVHIERTTDDTWDCMDDHGDCIEICINFGTDSIPLNPLPPHLFAKNLYRSEYRETDYLKEKDKLFTKNDQQDN